jgi:proteasome lid subunit RPN8/RPN11
VTEEQSGARRVICRARARDALLADLAARPHIEACGLLIGAADAGGGWLIDDALPLRNTHNATNYFEFDPEELLTCDLQWGERIVGAYHSHPGGPARPSRTDIGNMESNAGSPWVWLILSPRGATPLGPPPGGTWRAAGMAAFRVEEGQLQEFPVELDAPARDGAS